MSSLKRRLAFEAQQRIEAEAAKQKPEVLDTDQKQVLQKVSDKLKAKAGFGSKSK